MSQLKLTADSGGGTVAIKAPASTTGNAALDLTVPGTASDTLDTLGRAGNILQVVHTAKTSEFTSTSTSYTDLTGLSATITPQTGNKVLVIVEIQTYVEYDNNEGYGMQLVRTPSGGSGTNVYTAGSKFEVYGYTNSSSTVQGAMRSHWHFLDSSVGGDGSTAITYKVQVGQHTTSMIRYSQDGNLSSITLMEIAA